MTKRVLVIDDEPYIREVIQLCLQTVAGWEVQTAGSGQVGLRCAELEQPDAILLDVMMPGMDGVATFQRLQENEATRHIPVLFLTAKSQLSSCRCYADLGVQGEIAKPFDPLQLARQVAIALGWPDPIQRASQP